MPMAVCDRCAIWHVNMSQYFGLIRVAFRPSSLDPGRFGVVRGSAQRRARRSRMPAGVVASSPLQRACPNIVPSLLLDARDHQQVLRGRARAERRLVRPARRRGACARRRKRRRQVDADQDHHRRRARRRRHADRSAAVPVRAHRSAHRRARSGIAAIYQQPALFPDLTVAENIALALETRQRRGGASTGRRAGAARPRAARARRRGDRSRSAGRDAEHAGAAGRRDRQGDRRRRADPDHGRADRLAERARGRRACST